MKFSIIIPTFNRAHLLKKTLLALNKLDFDPNNFEVIVVDNNSTDATAKMVKKMSKKTTCRVEYVFEKLQGRTFASIAGMRLAQYDHIIYIDDDIDFNANLLKLYELVYQHFPQAAAVGGPIVAKFDQPITNWFLATAVKVYPWIFGELNHGPKIKRLAYPHGLFAGNLSINRRSFPSTEEIFSPLLGRPMDDMYLYGEDFEMCLRLHLQKKPIYYIPQLEVKNIVEVNRLTVKYIWHRLISTGIEFYLIDHILKNYPPHQPLAPLNWITLLKLPIYIGYWWVGPRHATDKAMLQSSYGIFR